MTTSVSNGLDTSNFVGGCKPSAVPVTDGAQSTYEGAILVTMLDSDLVDDILPTGLSLAQNKDPTIQTHPVIVLLGVQGDLRLLQGGKPVDLGVQPYTELILMIPFVVRDSGLKWHNYAVRMYLDNAQAIVIGDIFYAYAKEPAFFVNTATTTTVLQVGRVFKIDVQDAGPTTDLAAPGVALPAGLSQIDEVFKMPIVGHFDGWPYPYPPPPSYPFSCSYFEFDFSQTKVTPANGVFRFIQEFRPGMSGWVSLGEIANSPNGAFRISGMRWRLASEWPPWTSSVQPPACNFY